jgi:hypothetical protein
MGYPPVSVNANTADSRFRRRVRLPDKRAHRGAHPDDAELFAPAAVPRLREAVADLSWLLGRGYADPSAQKVVGDRYNLTQRQRTAVMRCACTDEAAARRAASRFAAERLRGTSLLLDGYNVLTTVEAALAGAVILRARDSAFRDVASMHGTWRKVEETRKAIELIGEVAAELGVTRLDWLLDSPVSNSGRLKTLVREVAASRGWGWTVELVPNPDAVLAAADALVATADSVILDRCRRWLNLAAEVVTRRVPGAWLIDLAPDMR